MIVTDWPSSIVADVGEIDTASAVFTVTAALVGGVAVSVGVAPPVVPVSVSVTVSTQVAVVPLGVNVSVAAFESTKPVQVPDATDQR